MIEIQFAVIVLLIAMTLVLSRYYNTASVPWKIR